MRLYTQTIVQDKMVQLLHKFCPKRRTGGHETHFGDGAALFIPERSLWISYDGGSHSVLQVFHTTFICYPHYLLKLWCRGSHSLLRLVQTIYIWKLQHFTWYCANEGAAE